ncbi:MAG: CCA tRNA nucleotidyltransferase [Hyphomicrobiales bacterium]|nr:CCA tRNA nucleotidyltransferase [Hyphomicrobiales bacterium]
MSTLSRMQFEPGRPAWLRHGPLPRLLEVLDRDGEEARVVGGAVRNELLGEPVEDIDVATTATPEEVLRRARAAGFKPVPTGIDHGTITVLVDGSPYEVTTLREDVETFGRRARVAFGRDWRGDAERRDFTMNALYLGRDGTIHDYVGGFADLGERRVRFIGDPASRIAEDYLRIMRFFRFYAAYSHGGAPDPAGLAACIAARHGLATLSRERVRVELLKLLLGVHAVPALATMSETGLLTIVLGGVPTLASFANLIKLERELSLAADPTRRLAALAVMVVEDADRLRERLRLSNVEHERLASMADGWWRLSTAITVREARALSYRLGPERYLDRMLLAWSRSWTEGVADDRWHDLALLPERWRAPVFPLKAADFLIRGVLRGPALGAALRAAEAAWVTRDFPPDAAALAQIADEAAAAARNGAHPDAS